MKVANSVRAMVSSEGGVLRDGKGGGTFGLNPVGAMIWQLLQQGVTTDEIIQRISEQFQAPREVVRQDVEEFLHSLEAHSLVRKN